MKWTKGDFLITDDFKNIDLDVTYNLLKDTYWGHRRSREIVMNMTKHSLCFSLIHNKIQIGFARVVSDYTVFSWIGDFVIQPEYRGNGIGKWMFSTIISHPKVFETQMVLQTGDGYGFYEKFDFVRKSSLMSRFPEKKQSSK